MTTDKLNEEIEEYIDREWYGYYVEGRKLKEMAQYFYELGVKKGKEMKKK